MKPILSQEFQKRNAITEVNNPNKPAPKTGSEKLKFNEYLKTLIINGSWSLMKPQWIKNSGSQFMRLFCKC